MASLFSHRPSRVKRLNRQSHSPRSHRRQAHGLRLETLETRQMMTAVSQLIDVDDTPSAVAAEEDQLSSLVASHGTATDETQAVAPVTGLPDSVPIVSRIQEIEFDPISRTERVLPLKENTLSNAWQDLIQNHQIAGGGEIDQLETPNGPDQFVTGAQGTALCPDTHGPGCMGTDDRVKVDNTKSAQWRTVGRIQNQEWPNGDIGSGCSGAMISPYHFLTAGYCVHDEFKGGWANNVTVAVGQDGSSRPFGEANVVWMRSYTSDTPEEDFSALALLTLDRRVGNTIGSLGYEWHDDDSVYDGMYVNTAGYPYELSNDGDDMGVDMYRASGPTHSASDYSVRYSGLDGLDTTSGQSGGPIWRYDGANRYVNAIVHGSTSSMNFGTRINEDRFDDLNAWISEDHSVRPPNDRPDLTDYDDWFGTNVAFFSPDPVEPGDPFSVQSWVQNNGTAVANNFKVSYYASTDTTITTSDYFLGEVTVDSVSPYAVRYAQLNTTFPTSIPTGDYYVGWIIDSSDTVAEFMEGNSSQLTVAVALFDEGGSKIASNTTALAGFAKTLQFSGLSPSTQYYLSVVPYRYDSLGSYQVDVDLDVTAGSISGRTVHDLDGDGTLDAGEPRVGWLVYVDLNDDGRWQGGDEREFAETGPIEKGELLARLTDTVSRSIQIISDQSAEALLKQRRIQGFNTTVAGAIIDSVAHFRGHSQEIISLTRQQLKDRYEFYFVPKSAEQGA